MRKEEFTVPSTDGAHQLHVMLWQPDGAPSAVLQIVHGMVEHIGRYTAFAEEMCRRGLAVIGHDHLGHGLTAKSMDELGYIGPGSASDTLVADIWAVTCEAKARFPGVPNYILGHSMGSFLTRKYLTGHSRDVDRAVIMGTGMTPGAVAGLACLLTNVTGKLKGERHRSGFLTRLALGSYNKPFSEPKSPCAWLTKDEQIVRVHDQDPYATFTFTVNAYRALFSTLKGLAKWTGFENVRRDLPVLIVSGDKDPVGSFGKGPAALCEAYRARGMQDVTLRLYPDDRHEILNELDREQVYDDIFRWLTEGAL